MKYPLRFPLLDRSIPLILASYGIVSLMELVAPLRKTTQSFLPRNLENFGISIPTFFSTRFLFMPAAYLAAQWNQQHGRGLLKIIAMPSRLKHVLAFLALDYSVYVWHYLAHNLPGIWRYHRVHHADRDLTASTAMRFHYLETILIGGFRALSVLLIGAGPRTLLLHETIFRISVSFHHSNWRLPGKLDAWLSHFLVTPEQHGIHHSVRPEEANSNFSTIFNIWDRLHRTLRLGVPQDDICIGTPKNENIFG